MALMSSLMSYREGQTTECVYFPRLGRTGIPAGKIASRESITCPDLICRI